MCLMMLQQCWCLVLVIVLSLLLMQCYWYQWIWIWIWEWSDFIVLAKCGAQYLCGKFLANHPYCWEIKELILMNWSLRIGIIITLYTERIYNFDKNFITVCTRSCQNDNLWCSQWWKFHPNNDFSSSVYPLKKTYNLSPSRSESQWHYSL